MLEMMKQYPGHRASPTQWVSVAEVAGIPARDVNKLVTTFLCVVKTFQHSERTLQWAKHYALIYASYRVISETEESSDCSLGENMDFQKLSRTTISMHPYSSIPSSFSVPLGSSSSLFAPL